MLVRLVLSVSSTPLQRELKRLVEGGDVVLECYSRDQFSWQRLMRSCADIVVVSQSMIPEPHEASIAMLNDLPENPTTVVLYDDDSSDSQTRLITIGADVALSSQVNAKSLAEAIVAVIEARQQYVEKSHANVIDNTRPRLSDFTSHNKEMHQFMKEVYQVAKSGVPLLLLGETGVGKEHLARAIHADSPRSAGGFVTVNTAAIPEQLLESELFGHSQGAFTGAMRSRRGAFEQAHRGTIFLDEIGEMPLSLQAKLLHCLQDCEVRPLGSEKPVFVDVRVVAATNRDLEEEVRQGRFRKDLFYRLSVVPLTVPPLRQRREDIPGIINRFMTSRRWRYGRECPPLCDEAMSALCRYDWPGNVRELFNVLERAIILSEGQEEISVQCLPQVFWQDDEGGALTLLHEQSERWLEHRTLSVALEESRAFVEQRYVENVLIRTKGRVGEAAQLAGVSPRNLYNMMKRLGIRKETFRGKGE